MFSKYSEIPQTPENMQRRRDTKKEILDMAKATEQQIKALKGELSESLIEVYCLYSYFEFQENRFSDGMLY